MRAFKAFAAAGVALAALATVPSSALANVATFEGYPIGVGTCSGGGDFDGLSISTPGFACTLGPSDYSNWPEQPASNIEVILGGTTITLASPGAFRLTSMDMQLGTYNANLGSTDTLTITGHFLGGGTTTFVRTLSDPMQTYAFNWIGLTSVDVSSLSGGGYTGFDNIVFNAVPEPATWAMMLVGLGGLGAAMRARRKPVAGASAA
jgi:hypothetical protein